MFVSVDVVFSCHTETVGPTVTVIGITIGSNNVSRVGAILVELQIFDRYHCVGQLFCYFSIVFNYGAKILAIGGGGCG